MSSRTTWLLLALFCAACAGGSSPSAPPPQPAVREPVSGTLQVPGGQLAYEVLGAGPPVVLIHGAFLDRRMWDEQFQAFAVSGRRVVRYDVRGFGESPLPKEPYSQPADLLRLLDHLEAGRAHLVGLSMGGSIALDFALLHPDRVASLVLASAGPSGYPIPREDIDRILEIFRAAREQGSAAAVERFMAHPMLAVSAKDPDLAVKLRRMVEENAETFRAPASPAQPIQPPANERLGEVRAPTLVVVGDRDTPLNRELAAVLEAKIPGARGVTLAGADHMVNMVRPEEFNRAVLELWDGL